MRLISNEELFAVAGGSDWSGDEYETTWRSEPSSLGSTTPPREDYFVDDWGVVDAPAVETITITGSFAQGVSTAISDCANGAEVGGLIGLVSPIGPVAGALIGCTANVGIGIIRDY